MSVKVFRTTRIMLLSTALIILSVAILVSVNIYLIERSKKHLVRIDNIRSHKIENVLKMQVIVRERSMVMLNMYLEEDPWEIDEQFLHFKQLAVEFIALKDSFLNSSLNENERLVYNDIIHLIRVTEPLQNNIVERIKSENKNNLGYEISERDMQLERQLLILFDSLLKIITDNANAAHKAANDDYSESIALVYFFSLLVVIAISILMFYSLRRVQKVELNLIQKAESLSWDATHDHLTQVFNRRWLSYKVDFMCADRKSSPVLHSLIYIDLDDFKPVNDRYGHMAGDLYLESFCREIESCIRQNDTLARIGGDEFALLLENCNTADAMKIADTIHTRLRHFSVDYAGQKISAGCSMGLLTFRSCSAGFEEIIRRADELCYQAKTDGKNSITSAMLE